MGSEKQQEEEEEERWLVGCLPSFSFSVTAQEHALHSLKEKGLHYFDGTQQQCGNGTLLQLLGIGGEEKE